MTPSGIEPATFRFVAHPNGYCCDLMCADSLAKMATANKNIPESYNKIPKSVVMKDLEEESVKKWQRKWSQTTKGRNKKEYFPDVAERLMIKL